MNILLITYADLSLQCEQTRSVAMLRALADAGHQIDVVAPTFRIPPHPCVTVLSDKGNESIGRMRIRKTARQAVRKKQYDAVHAVDDAVLFASRLVRWKKTHLIYDASRRFTGGKAINPSWLWKALPKYFSRKEARAVAKSSIIYSSCTALTADLRSLDRQANIFQIEDVPAQPLTPCPAVDKSDLLKSYKKQPGPIVACSLLPGTQSLRNVFVAVLKISVVAPDITFFFRTQQHEQAKEIMLNLDISNRCICLPIDAPEAFMEVLQVADATLFAPPMGGRYIHPQVYTLLRAGVPLVAIHDSVYDGVLTEQTSIPVMPDSDSIAHGLLRAIQEPLFSLCVATEGEQLVADYHSFSTFKHKIRMSYHDVLK